MTDTTSSKREKKNPSDKKPGYFYFCKGADKEKGEECNRKYITSEKWFDHMNKVHGKTDIALPCLEQYNGSSKQVKLIKTERVEKQRKNNNEVIKQLKDQLKLLTQQADSEQKLMQIRNEEKLNLEARIRELDDKLKLSNDQRENNIDVINNLKDQLQRTNNDLKSMQNQNEEKLNLEAQIRKLDDKLKLLNSEVILQGSDDCVICFDEKTTTAMIPCGHTVCCQECAKKINTTSKTCPICRASIKSIQRIYGNVNQ